MSDWNQQVIEEFRSRGGRTEQFGLGLVLVHHRGARSGVERINPLAFQSLASAGPDGAPGWAVFASAAGSDKTPDWFHNLVAHPDTTIEVGDGTTVSTVAVHARVLPDDEREPVWQEQKRLAPGFADYEAKTDRQIPVVELSRR